MRRYNNYDFQLLQLLNVVVDKQETIPTAITQARFIYVTGTASNPINSLYYCNGTTWVKIASQGDLTTALNSYVKNTRKVIAGTGLSGGGALSADVTISHNTIATTNPTTGDYVSGNTINNGHVTAITKANFQALTFGTKTYKPNKAATITLADLGGTTMSDVENKGYATKTYVDEEISSKIVVANGVHFKGTIGTGGTVTALPTSNVKVGDLYVVKTAGTYASNVCEVGDMIIATATTPTWSVIQANINGAVTSSANSVTANTIPIFDGTTGKIIKGSGFTIGKSVPSNAVFTDTKYNLNASLSQSNAFVVSLKTTGGTDVGNFNILGENGVVLSANDNILTIKGTIYNTIDIFKSPVLTGTNGDITLTTNKAKGIIAVDFLDANNEKVEIDYKINDTTNTISWKTDGIDLTNAGIICRIVVYK